MGIRNLAKAERAVPCFVAEVLCSAGKTVHRFGVDGSDWEVVLGIKLVVGQEVEVKQAFKAQCKNNDSDK